MVLAAKIWRMNGESGLLFIVSPVNVHVNHLTFILKTIGHNRKSKYFYLSGH